MIHKISFFTIILSLAIQCSFAQKTWNGSVNDQWDNFANWTPEGPPLDGESIIIPNTGLDPIRLGKSIIISPTDSLVIHENASLIITGVVSDTAIIINGNFNNRGALFISNSRGGLRKSSNGNFINFGDIEITASFSGLRLENGMNTNHGDIEINAGSLTPFQVEDQTEFNNFGTITVNGEATLVVEPEMNSTPNAISIRKKPGRN